MSGSKEGHDTEKRNAIPASTRLTAWIAAGIALFVFSGTIAACGGNTKAATPVVPFKAMSAVFYEKPDDALPKIPAPAKPPAPPAPVLPSATAPVRPAPPQAPATPTWTYTARPIPQTEPTERTRAYTPPESVTMPRDEVQAYARSLVGSSYEFTCLAHIVERESGWNPQAINQSGAYGVPQSLPGAKMASEGSDWRTNPKTQLRWMVKYVNSRYGGACNAWSSWQRQGWY